MKIVDGIRLRIFDTVDLAQAGYYHAAQHGSYSIKQLAPALLGHGYEDLEIQSGMAAVVAWKQASDSNTPQARREELEGHLVEYCGRDTDLLHQLVGALERVAHES